MNKSLSINSNYLKYTLFNKYKKDTVEENFKALSQDIEKNLDKKIHWRTLYNNVNGITFRMSTVRAIVETLELNNNKIFCERFEMGE